MKDALIKLLKVKSLVTLVVTLVFAYLAITGTIEADKVMEIYLIVVGFYFGTQSEKSDTSADNNTEE